ncbi:lipocalin-like domain-containing protein [Amphritea sp. HPY]|uniref:lipocalin-like domain-containing protein n=1 Tax=Amphritea sp. HPY TaxID=3421652 RepID=UPI003D7E277F
MFWSLRSKVTLLLLAIGTLVVIIAVIGLRFYGDDEHREAPLSALSMTDFLSADSQSDQGFARARPDYTLVFPRDHLAHPAFRSEWWYLNGNLWRRDDPDHHLGFQFTIFRQALAVSDPAGKQAVNQWLQPQFYMGHIALADFRRGVHLSAERFSRQGPGLAGSSGEPPGIWLESWNLKSSSDQALFPALVTAGDPAKGFSYQLRLISEKPKVLQGSNGYSPKRPEPGFASYYYSFTRLRVEGVVQIAGESVPVSGLAWYDHEWSSNSLAQYQTGWDWFSLQLDDGREMMFIVLRSDSGKQDFRQVSLIDKSGVRLPLEPDQVDMQATGIWRSPAGVSYPSGWRIKVPYYGLDLEIIPRHKDQENRLSVRYWEGAVEVTGSHRGEGYVELTGY